MSPERIIFQRSKRPLNLLAGAIFLALSLLFGGIYLRDSLKADLAKNQALLGSQRTSLETKRQDLANIRQHIERFRLLKQQGLVGRADREGWVEQLVASREQLGVGSSISYNLKPPLAMADSMVPDAAAEGQAAAPTALAADAAATHDLDFELVGIHEGELMAFLNHYQAKVQGSFRIQSCRLGRPAATGLAANCTLRFFNLPEPTNKQ